MSALTLIAAAPEELFSAAKAETAELTWDAAFEGEKFTHVSVIDLEFYPSPALHALVNWVKTETGQAALGKILLAKLPAGQSIESHVNSNPYHDFHTRHHIPMITDAAVKLVEGEEETHMEEGSLYKLNKVEHGFKNESTIDRIHLIIDTFDQ